MHKVIFIFLVLAFAACKEKTNQKQVPLSKVNWSSADSIVNSIHQAVFPEFVSTVKPTSESVPVNHIQEAIDKVASKGGGTVILKAGKYLSNPIVLKSNIHLKLEEGAILQFNTDVSQYPLVYTWFESIPCMNFSPMIYAKDLVNIKISGNGIIDGQGDSPEWKSMKIKQNPDWNLLKKLEREQVKPENRHFGMGHNLRPDLITFVNCSRIEVSGVSLMNAPYWSVHPILCDNMIFSKLNITGQGFNKIGLAPECSTNMLVDQVRIQGMDVGIQIKSGRAKVDPVKSSENIVIQHSVFKNNRISFQLGSKMKAGINRIFISGITVNQTQSAITILNDAQLKGKIHDIFIRDIDAVNIQDQFLYCRIYNASEKNTEPMLYNIRLEDLRVDSCARAFHLDGDGFQPITNLHFGNATFNSAKDPIAEDVVNLSFKNFTDGELVYNESFNIKDVRNDKFDRKITDQDILDADNIHLDEVPGKVKETLANNFPKFPIESISRIITKKQVLYEVDLVSENSRETILLISATGEIIRTKQDVGFHEIPDPVFSALKAILGSNIWPQMMEEIKKISVHDFVYYEIKCETRNNLFDTSIAGDGSILEQKQKVIKASFPLVIKNEKNR